MSRPLRVLAAVALAAGTALASAAPVSAAPLPGVIQLKPGSMPEGIAGGPGSTYYAGSMANGAVFTGDVRTGSRRVLVPGTGPRAARGMDYDERSGVLWVAGEQRLADGSTRSSVTAYDAQSGKLLRREIVPGERFLNDVEVAGERVYVTDSRNPELVVVTVSGHELLPLRGDWVQPAGFGANGIRLLPTGDLVVTKSETGELFRVGRASGVADRIELTGPRLRSGDGITVVGSTLYVVYGFGTDAVAIVELGEGARNGRVVGRLGDPDLDRPTTAIVAAGSLWAVNGRFGTPATPSTRYQIVRVPLAG